MASFCVGGRHRSATTNSVGDIHSKGNKVLIGYCLTKKWKNSMSVSDNSIQAKGLGNFVFNLGGHFAKAGKNLATKVINNRGRALEVTSNTATAAATTKPKMYYKHYQRWWISMKGVKERTWENL